MSVPAIRPFAHADRVDIQTLGDISDFLYHESGLLDAGLYAEWFELIDPAIRYVIPTRITVANGEGSGITNSSHIDDAYSALRSRVARMKHPLNWAENPASRTRHHVSNIRAMRSDGSDPAEFLVHSNLLFYRERMDETHGDMISSMRQDRLVRVDAGFRLRERVVILDHTTLGTHNVAFLL